MRICGLKVTHDAAVAIVEDGRLRFCCELEKLANSSRHVRMRRLRQVTDILAAEGIDPRSVDAWSIDGWGDTTAPATLALSESGETVEVAGYLEQDERDALRVPGNAGAVDLPGAGRTRYVSYAHSVDHALSAYATSPFARRRQSALILVWDGGMPPTLYHFDPGTARLRRAGSAGPWFGNLYPDFISHFGPFSELRARPGGPIPYQLSLPGTAMAYAAVGRTDAPTYHILTELLRAADYGRDAGDELARRYLRSPSGADDADVIATFQQAVGDLLAERVRKLVSSGDVPRLCLSGGCALNIGWNSRIRATAPAKIWVPPFPNDSGIAIGAAAAAMAARGNHPVLDWDVYAGPALLASGPVPGWTSQRCSPEEVGQLLAREGEPVVVLNGRAELGPRALGNRSILAPPWDGMTKRLNDIKGREPFRPVAPICLEADAAEIFDPGYPDPYMLFVHTIRSGWAERISAVRHLDGTARLQTLAPGQNPQVASILAAFASVTSVPVLCNTSANAKGSGFFPDARSAMSWGGTNYVWSEGMLYTRAG